MRFLCYCYEMSNTLAQKFCPGSIDATPAALRVMAEHYVLPQDLLDRHCVGDWGEIELTDWCANDNALQSGDRLFSSYLIAPKIRVWVVSTGTDSAGERETTIFLPSEF